MTTAGRAAVDPGPLRARIVGPEDPAWHEAIDAVEHDFYHLPGYLRISATHEGGRPVAVIVDGDDRQLLLPLLLRDTPGGEIDATSPYGYPGPVGRGLDQPAAYRAALLAALRVLEEDGVVSLFVRLHPLINRTFPSDIGVLVDHGETVVTDLSHSADEFWRETRREHRRGITKALKAGFAFRVSDDPAHHHEFRDLYRERMDALLADSFYHFDDAYFDGLRETLEGRLKLGIVARGDEVAAAGLLSEVSGIVQTHLIGWAEAYADIAPSKLWYHGVRAWAKTRGDRWLHYGGGVGAGEDSLMHFKSGFSPDRLVYRSLRVVLRPDAYARLVAESGQQEDATSLTGWFPAYRRAPIPAADAAVGSPDGTPS